MMVPPRQSQSRSIKVAGTLRDTFTFLYVG